ncbi:transketolase [compost metagenome]
MGLEPLEEKWTAFGWNVVSINGNNMEELLKAFRSAPEVAGKPTLIMANTTKGKGVSFAENVPAWHHHVPNDKEFELALTELKATIEELTQKGQVH